MTSTLQSPSPPHLRHQPITVARNLKHEARTTEEDWSGLASPGERRKIQNRLNARAYRKRKTLQKQAVRSQPSLSEQSPIQLKDDPTPFNNDISDPNNTSLVSSHFTDQPYLKVVRRQRRLGSGRSNDDSPIPDNKTQCTFSSSLDRTDPAFQHMTHHRGRHAVIQRKDQSTEPVWAVVEANFAAFQRFVPDADNLLTLIYYNVYRAFVSNINLLGLDPMEMCNEDYPSPFCHAPPGSNSVADLDPSDPFSSRYPRRTLPLLPPALYPTETQKTIPHHPIMDVFPSAPFRDQMIYGTGLYDEQELCFDLLGDAAYIDEFETPPKTSPSPSSTANSSPTTSPLDTPVEKPPGTAGGMIVWGEPYLVESWELSEPFFRKWFWLLSACGDLIESSNRWRAKRGEGPLPTGTSLGTGSGVVEEVA